MENISVPKKWRTSKIIAAFLSLILLISFSSCSKKGTEEPTPNPPTLPPTVPTSFSAGDATIAFNSFNKIYYSTADKLSGCRQKDDQSRDLPEVGIIQQADLRPQTRKNEEQRQQPSAGQADVVKPSGRRSREGEDDH